MCLFPLTFHVTVENSEVIVIPGISLLEVFRIYFLSLIFCIFLMKYLGVGLVFLLCWAFSGVLFICKLLFFNYFIDIPSTLQALCAGNFC